MNWKRLIIFVSGFLLSLVLIAGLGVVLLPSRVVVTQKVTVAATEENLSNYFKDLKQWPKVLPWLGSDAANKKEYSLKKGKCFNWQYENSQAYQGILCLIESSSMKKVDIEISFKGKSSFFHELNFKQLDAIYSEITWIGSSETLKGLKKWEYVFIKQWLKHDIGIAIQHLPIMLAETGNTTLWLGELNEFVSPDTYVVFKIDTIQKSTMLEYLPKAWSAIRADAISIGLKTSGFPYCILRETTEVGRIAIEAGIILKAGSELYEGKNSIRLIQGDSLFNVLLKGPFTHYIFAVDSLSKASISRGFELDKEVIITYKDSSQTLTQISPKVPIIVSMYRK